MPKKSWGRGLVQLTKRVPAEVAGSPDNPGLAERLANRIERRLRGVYDEPVDVGDAILLALRLLEDWVNSPNFVEEFVERKIREYERVLDKARRRPNSGSEDEDAA